VTSRDATSGPQPPLARLVPDGNLAGSLYGTVLVTSVLATFEGSEQVGLIITAVFVTTLIFELAHAWADPLAESGAARRSLDRHRAVDRRARERRTAVHAGLRQLAGGTSLQALMAGLASASLGLVLIVLKVLVH
jgi:hypothetical protein